MDVQELRHLIAVAAQAMDEYLELNGTYLSNSDFRDCEEFQLAAGDARRALINY
jgi:hypothetical protein